MPILKRTIFWSRRRRLLGSAFLVCLVAVVVVIFSTAQGGSTELLHGVPPEGLAEAGVRISSPRAAEKPTVTAGAATTTALKYKPAASVRETVLVHLNNDRTTP